MQNYFSFIKGNFISPYLTGIKGILVFVSKMVHEVIFSGMVLVAKFGDLGKIVSG